MSPETITMNTSTRLPRDVLSMHQSARSSFLITDILAGSNVTTASTFWNENKNKSKKLPHISQHHSCKKAQTAKHYDMDQNQCSCADCFAPHQKQIAHSFNIHQPLENYGDFKLENLHSAQTVWYAGSNQTDEICKNLAIRVPINFCQHSCARLPMSAALVGVGTHKLTVQIEQGTKIELGSYFDPFDVNDDKTSTVEDSDNDTCEI